MKKKWTLITASLLGVAIICATLMMFSQTTTHAAGKTTKSTDQEAQENEISIIQQGKSILFTPSELKLTGAAGMVWYNNTDQTQTVVSDSKEFPSFKISPQQYEKMFFNSQNTYAFHLESDPTAVAKIHVEIPVPANENAIAITAAKGDLAHFEPGSIKIAANIPVQWTNQTDETQTIVSDNDALKPIKIAAHETVKTMIDKNGEYHFHLVSNAKAEAIVVIHPVTEPTTTVDEPTVTVDDNTISITANSGSTLFKPDTLKVKVTSHVVWHNDTKSDLVIVSDNKATAPIKVAAGASEKLVFDKAGTYTFHLANGDSKGSATIYVF